jgi:hypothetical protein
MPISSLNSSGKNTISAGGDVITSNVLLSGRLDVSEIREVMNDISIISASVVVSYEDANVFYVTSTPAANFTINLTNSPTDNGRMFGVAFVVTQGSTGYIPNVFAINGTVQTIKWLNSSAPTPTSSSGKIDIFNFTILRRSDAWIVLGTANTNLG